MSGQGKLTIRPLPHLDFVLGWPGIPGSSSAKRNSSHIAGNVEVRLGSKGMRCKWLRIELRKIETVHGGENWAELIGSGPIDVWSAKADKGEQDADGSCWEVLKSKDFPFRINIPEALPPTAKLDKLCGIQYEVVTSLCVKTKKGLLRKEDTSSVIQSVHPITLDKHELHSTWPAYNHPDTHAGERDALRAKLRRERYCYAPGDKVRVKVIVMSNRVEPAKLKSVAVTIKETVTFHGVKPKKQSITSNSASAKPSMQRVDVVVQKAKSIGKKLYKGDSKDFDLELIIPKQHPLMSISTAKHIEVSYTMRLYVDISKAPIIIDHIPMMMTTFPRSTSLVMMKKIGFVEGLSEREMVIDDDFDDASTTQGVSRSVRPAPGRSLSYGGSSGTGSTATYDQNGFLQRRDTVMTNATAGMAGRGVPGQLFNFNPLEYQAPSPFGMANGAPRSAFAGPGDENNQLSEAERSALFHHTNDPRNAQAAGVDYEDITSLEPTWSGFNRMQGDSTDQRMSFAGFPTMTAPISRPQSANVTPSMTASEGEKERLYQRARQQAERNQRLAEEQRSAMAGQNGSDSVMSHDSVSSLQAASEQEKMRLWERARREAETYQRGYAEGASFPADTSSNSISSRMSTPALGRVDENYAFGDGQATPDEEDAVDDELASRLSRPRQNSAMFWIDGNAGSPAPVVKPRAVATGAQTSYASYPSAEEEKKRLYDQAKAETDRHAQMQGSSSMSPSVSNGSSIVASLPSSKSLQMSASNSTNSLSEKEQLRRFHAAQDAVRQNQLNQFRSGDAASGSSNAAATSAAAAVTPLSEKEQLARYHAAQEQVQKRQVQQQQSSSRRYSPPPTFEASQSNILISPPGTPAIPSAPVSEKEQMRKYYEARDREGSAAGGSSSNAAAAATMMASPRPVYAPNFHNLPAAHSPSTTPLPQAPFPKQQQKPRVVSYQPSSQLSAQQQQQQQNRNNLNIPSLSQLSIERGATPSPLDGPWAPKVANSSWIDDDDEDESAGGGGGNSKRTAPPPPLPPKTMSFSGAKQ